MKFEVTIGAANGYTLHKQIVEGVTTRSAAIKAVEAQKPGCRVSMCKPVN